MTIIPLLTTSDIPLWQTTNASTRDTLAAKPGVYGVGAWAHFGNLGLPSAATGYVESVTAGGGATSILKATLLVSGAWKQYGCRKASGVWEDWSSMS
ncbi:hypothetical protein U6G28_08740 [Actinomycetaceae bacterium MB13-C1-2]|nr:hypothetical protein U6G28_08740 [Actinomycetaceae bacterium MB13-C1-2]